MPLLSAKDKSPFAKKEGSNVGDQEVAFRQAARNARLAGADQRQSRRKRLTGRLIPLGIAAVGAGVAALMGTELARTAFGRLVNNSLGPIVQTALSLNVYVYVFLAVILGIGVIMWFIRS